MQPTLDKSVRPSRVRFRRFSFPARAFGLCALICLLQQAALGQAQMGAAETCFAEGPDRLPATPNTPVPSLRTEMPAQIVQLLKSAHAQPAREQMARTSHVLSRDSRARSNPAFKKKAPEGTLTAAR
jgi:hypothetical protein